MSTDPAHLLLIEDEAPIRGFLRAALNGAGYRLTVVDTGEAGLRAAVQQPPDVVILDLGLPDIDGSVVLERLREWFHAPILILSARDQESQKVAALDAGADDYLTKPFSTSELLARLRAALRRSASAAGTPESPAISIGDLSIDLAARRVFCRNLELHLTPIEYRLLTLLAKNVGRVLTHRYLLKEVWGPQSANENHYLRVFMANLRRKVEVDPARPRHLRTEPGVGYRLVE